MKTTLTEQQYHNKVKLINTFLDFGYLAYFQKDYLLGLMDEVEQYENEFLGNILTDNKN